MNKKIDNFFLKKHFLETTEKMQKKMIAKSINDKIEIKYGISLQFKSKF